MLVLLLLSVGLSLQPAAPDTSRFLAEGENRYFILKPGYQLRLLGKESGKQVELVVTVTDDTRVIAGTRTRVVEERESQGGELVEISRNYFAFEPSTKNIYYFGEDVDIYQRGTVVNHEGSWLAGVAGARFGLMMPGTPRVGMKHFQEQAGGLAMDHAEIVSLTERVVTPAGTFAGCLKTKETTPLEKGAVEYKVYAPGIGLLKDGELTLASYGYRR
jgi:hypothetical protein